MIQTLKILRRENIVSIKELQKSPSRYLRGLTRIQKGKETLGFFLDKSVFGNLIEDMEALNSPKYLKSVQTARRSHKHFSLDQVKMRYGLK